jgi:MYXO-CTERM domain-containing protein
VCRYDYAQGDVSVLLSVTGGTARKGRDFRIVDPVRVKWRNGERDCQPVGIEIIDDNEVEPAETIELALSDPTGGALLGAGKTLTIQIADNDTSSGGAGGGGGGGNGGGLLALLAAAGAWLRRRRREP